MRLFLLLLAGFALATGCRPSGSAGAPTSGASPAPVPVATAPVTRTREPRFQDVPGTLQAVDRATVSAQIMGVATAPDLAVGRIVSAGEVLVTLAADQIAAQVAQARAALDLATSDHARESRLLAQGASTADLVRSLADRRRIAEAALAQAEAQLAYTRVTAPFDGIITRRHIETGDVAAPGSPLFDLEGRTAFEVEVAVPDSLPFLGVGEPVTLLVSDRQLPGTLREASPAADPATRTRLARIALTPDAGLRSGQYVRARWPAGDEDVLSVPTAALSRFGQLQRVFVADHGRAVLRLVRTGATRDDRTAILAGVNPGETVVLNPPAGLRDGTPLEIAP